jgi:SH3-like domain-containing protein
MYLSRILLSLNLLFIAYQSQALCVNVGQANLRAEPKPNSRLLWTVGRYMPLLEVKYQGGWYLVKDLEGQKMWIASQLVSDDIDCAVIRVNQSNLRTEPDAKASKTPLSVAYKYMPFKKLQREENWLYLQDAYGGKHWVIDSNLWEPLEYTRLSY